MIKVIIKINNEEVGEIIYKEEDYLITPTKKSILASFKKLQKFYKISVPKIEFKLVYSRREFNKIARIKTPNWMAGLTSKKKIYLISPMVIKKISTHDVLSFKKIIAHELSHVFNKQINKKPLRWVNEGLALFLANQEKNKNIKVSDWELFFRNFMKKNTDFKTFVKLNGYKISYWTIKKIAKKYGIKKLKLLLKIKSGKQFESSLKSELGISSRELKGLLVS